MCTVLACGIISMYCTESYIVCYIANFSLRCLPTVVYICPTPLQYMPINADYAYLPLGGNISNISVIFRNQFCQCQCCHSQTRSQDFWLGGGESKNPGGAKKFPDQNILNLSFLNNTFYQGGVCQGGRSSLSQPWLRL